MFNYLFSLNPLSFVLIVPFPVEYPVVPICVEPCQPIVSRKIEFACNNPFDGQHYDKEKQQVYPKKR